MIRIMETRNKVRPYMPQHPGSVLKAELRERGIKQKSFAEAIGMRPPHLSALLHGARNISPQVAAKIEAVLHIPAHIWLTLQNNYNLDVLRPCELVDGYNSPVQGESVCALAESSPEEKSLWRLAFRAGQKDAVDKIAKALKEIGLSEDQIRQATTLSMD